VSAAPRRRASRNDARPAVAPRGSTHPGRAEVGRDLTPRHARRRRAMARPTLTRPRAARPRRAALDVLGVATRPALRLAVLLALIAGLIVAIRQPAFTAARVEVGGLHHLTRAAVLRAAALEGSPALFLISPDRASAAIAADPWVRDVSVEALLPGTVRVSVVEWQPAAVLTAGNSSYLLTEVGTVLGPAAPGTPGQPGLTIRTPAHTLAPRDSAIGARLLSDLGRMRDAFPADFGLTVGAFEIDGGGRLTADTVNGPRILFGQMVTEEQVDSLDAKLGALSALRQKVDLAHSGFDYLNLMNPGAPATHVPAPSPSPSPSPRPAGAAPRPKPSPSAGAAASPGSRGGAHH
jgi:hypothetical protein